MTTQPNVTPDYAAARERFAANVAKFDAPANAKPAAAPVQSQPNAELAARAKALQSAVDPATGKRVHSPQEAQAAWNAAYSTPPSGAGPGSDRGGYTSPEGVWSPTAPPPGFKYEANPNAGKPGVSWQRRLVPDPSYAPKPVSEPDAFSQQSAERIAELGPERAAQNAALDGFAARINPATGKRYAEENPVFRANLEKARSDLFGGVDLADVIAATEASLAASVFAPQVQAEGYTLTAPEGFELDAGEIRKYAAIAKANGVSQEAFQQMVETYVRENAE